ncbi:hypothetical protein [Streptomyces sp. NPDC048277]|uniref:hypothetical protein n=1 Tax=Streptomyces sp. NPDC048277 TaxID=3155027 RepID=UPI0033F5795D
MTRCLAGERVCRLHRIGWMSPGRERTVRFFLKSALRAQPLLPDHRTPLPGRHAWTPARRRPGSPPDRRLTALPSAASSTDVRVS